MNHNFLPFAKPNILESDIEKVCEVLRSGWITTGPKALELEQEFCKKCEAKNAVAVSSATAGMHIMLKALGIGPSDEVITPSMTWVSTINLITLAGAKPIFVDVDKDTLMVNANEIEEKITNKTKAIIPVHYAGASLDLNPIRKIAKDNNICLIEDAAHASGTYYKNEPIGKNGTAIFSFHPIKNMTTGEGGLIVSDDEKLINRLKRLKFHGLGVDAFDRKAQGRSPQAEVLEPGYKYNLPDMNAVLGISQLNRLDKMNKKRTQLAELYNDLFESIEEISPLKQPNYNFKHSWHLYIIRLNLEKVNFTRDFFMEQLKKRNIGSGIHFKAAHLHKYYVEEKGFKRGMLKNTEWNSDRILSIPLFPDMEESDVSYVVENIKKILGKYK